MTHFRTSATAVETETQHVCATQLTTRPGTLPTVTIPITGDRQPDADRLWQYLQEPADFFGIRMPERSQLTAALAEVGAKRHRDCLGQALVAVSVTIVESDGTSHFLLSGAAVQLLHPEPVRVAGDDSMPHAHRATDPWWQRMAARTTSKGELDQRERWLNGRGYVDGLSHGEPVLGALVFETSGGVVGVENPEPTSILDQLAQCGVFSALVRVPTPPSDATRVWWVSPRYEVHPVVELGGMRFVVDDGGSDEAVPSFARWS